MWKAMKLGNIVKPVGGSGFPKKYQGNSEGEIPFFKVSDMNLPDNNRFMYLANNYVSRETLKEMKGKAYPAGTIIFPKIGGAISTNKKRILTTESAFDNNVMGLVPSEEITSEYLYWFFLSLDLYEISNKAALPSITATAVKEIDIALPPLAEQRRIVAKLDAAFAEIDKAINSIDAKTKQSEDLKASVLATLLRGNAVRLGDVCELAYGKSLDKSERVDDSGFPAFGANGVKTLSKAPLYEYPSIIIGRKGSAGEINKVTEPFWALDVTYYTKIDEKIINIDYLFYVLTTLNLPSLARGVKPGINRNDVYEKTIPLPSLSEQQTIVAEIDAAFAKIETIDSATLAIKDNYISLKSAFLAQELNKSEAA